MYVSDDYIGITLKKLTSFVLVAIYNISCSNEIHILTIPVEVA